MYLYKYMYFIFLTSRWMVHISFKKKKKKITCKWINKQLKSIFLQQFDKVYVRRTTFLSAFTKSFEYDHLHIYFMSAKDEEEKIMRLGEYLIGIIYYVRHIILFLYTQDHFSLNYGIYWKAILLKPSFSVVMNEWVQIRLKYNFYILQYLYITIFIVIII